MPNDLDDRIRSLVAAAVETAPAPPNLDSVRVAPRSRKPLKWGAILAALVAAAGGGYVALQPADNSVDTTKRPDTSTTIAPAPEQPAVIVTAGPDGIRERIGDDSRTISDEPTGMALALDDGTFVAQRRSGRSYVEGNTWPKSDTSVVRVDQDGKRTPLFDAVSGFVRLHDFAVVDGRRILIYSVHNGSPTDPNEKLYALDLDDVESGPTDLGSIAGWESSTSRLTLGSTGLIIGTSHGVCCSAGNFLAIAVPDSPAAAQPLPKATDFGLSDNYEDGCICPTAFAVDPDGTAVYWLAPVDGVANVTVIRASLADPMDHAEVAPVARLDASKLTVMSIDADDDRFVVNYGDTDKVSTKPSMMFSKNSSAELEDGFATLGPNG